MFLVAALSTRWDWYLTEKPTGKVVWCEIEAGPVQQALLRTDSPLWKIIQAAADVLERD